MESEIPESNHDNSNFPSWKRVLGGHPLIYCTCGELVSIQEYTLTADGVLSPSFHHAKEGCEWHVHLKLNGYSNGN